MEGNNLKSLENLTRIFETRIKLDKETNIETPPDVLINYEKYTKKIDSIYNDKFEKEIRSLITPEKTIEKEEDRLKKLINLLKERLRKREELENKYYLTTGGYINSLQIIISSSELEEKQNRLDRITRYLDTRNEINNVTSSKEELIKKLKEETIKEEAYTKQNKIMEEKLYTTFLEVTKEDDYLSKINEEDINEKLTIVIDKTKENKETLDVTKESVNSLLAGLVDNDYISYIEDAERAYFTWENREVLLKIYNILIIPSEDYNELFDKRDKINKLLRKRRSIKDSLSIDIEDNLLSFENTLKEQLETLKEEKEVIENVTNYTNRISFKEERLEELEKLNNDIELLSILREYNLIDTYDSTEDIDNCDINEDIDTIIKPKETPLPQKEEEEIIVKEINPYRIVEVEDYPKTLNLGLAKLKGESVREKVNKKLNPKMPTFEDLTLSANEDIEDTSLPIEEKIESSIPPKTIPEEKEEVNTISIENNIPLWSIPDEEIKIEQPKEELPKIDLEDKPTIDNSMFWVPVSDAKLENNSFPNINIDLGNNKINNTDNFGFPNLNS